MYVCMYVCGYKTVLLCSRNVEGRIILALQLLTHYGLDVSCIRWVYSQSKEPITFITVSSQSSLNQNKCQKMLCLYNYLQRDSREETSYRNKYREKYTYVYS